MLPPLALGLWHNFGSVDNYENMKQMCFTAFDHGITHFDLANNYGPDAFYNFIGVCESTPGPIAVNMATYVGSTQAGLSGGIVATLGVITPSFFIILLIAAVLKNLTKNTYVQGFLYGIKPVILALILATGINMLLKSTGYVSLSEYDVNIPAIIILCLLAGIYFFIRRKWKQKLSAISLILLSAVLGIVVSVIAEHIR